MADLFTVTAPLQIRLPDGSRTVMAHHFRHPQGMLWFDLWWHLGDPDETIHLAEGQVHGEGPWRVGECVVQVLGCQGADPLLATRYRQWQDFLAQAQDYPPPPLVAAIARRFGAHA